MKKVTQALIEGLSPCKDRLDNYLKFYKGKEFRATQFMGLKNITQADKVWVAFRLMPKDNIRLVAADIAESVLHLWEKAYPNDDRPRKAIEAARSGDKDAAAASYASAARAASAAPAYAARVAARASAAAARAAARYAASASAAAASASARYAATAARVAANAADKPAQEKAIRKILLRYWK